MFGFNRARAEVGIQHPPVEPSASDLVDEARIAELDERAYLARRCGKAAEWDRALDLRNAIRPATPRPVPVIPGRAS